MKYNKKLEGIFTYLKSVEVEDAEFILKLRTDANISRFLNKTENDIKKQIKWIEEQQIRTNDYYFIIYDKTTDKKVGTYGIYNINNEQGEFGRFICIDSPVQSIETGLLIADFAFNALNLEKAIASVDISNKKTISFQNKNKLKVVYTKEENGRTLQYSELTKNNYFENVRPNLVSLIENLG